MKKLSQVVFIIGIIAIAGLVVFGVATLASRALGPGKQTTKADCKESGTDYTVSIKNGEPTINDIEAKLCDKLTIINEDDQLRLIAFGVHENHQAYGGVTEQTLEQGDQLSVVLNETGSYTFHDHLNDSFTGKFTVR